VFRFLLWRVLALGSGLLGLAVLAWVLQGGIARSLRAGGAGGAGVAVRSLAGALLSLIEPLLAPAAAVLALCALASAICLALRTRARRRRRYARLVLDVYHLDFAEPKEVARAFSFLHAALVVTGPRRLLEGQPSVAVEVHHRPAGEGRSARSWLAVCCRVEDREAVETAMRTAYPNVRLDRPADHDLPVPALLRLAKHRSFTTRIATPDPRERSVVPVTNDVLTAMGALGAPAYIQIALTPASHLFEALLRQLYRQHERHLSRSRREHLITLDRSMLLDSELRGGLEVQHRYLFFADVRVVAPSRRDCRRVAASLQARRAENRLAVRSLAPCRGPLAIYGTRVGRGEGNPFPDPLRGVLAPGELAELWQAPSVDYSTVPFARGQLPLAPAPPGVFRPAGPGILRDQLGPISIHPELRRQNVAVPGAVEQGKSSLLVASVVEDLQRDACAVIVLDPKGDAAEAALSAVPPGRVCTYLDFAHPTCGFNPLAVDAPADVIADYVVGALKQLFTESDIRASSDRYLRNAVIAVLSHDSSSTLWDAARLLSVGQEGYAYRRAVASRLRTLPELKEISQFFAEELSAQLADARSATTSKLDAPVNKLARLLNSPSIKRVLLNGSLVLDFDRVIAGSEVVIVKGALGALGTGNTAVLMQLLLGMLDAALARQQDRQQPAERTAVALKIDEAPLVVNSGFAQTMALKRSAGLETLACWQADSQWVDRDVRDQLDALFAHRVYFATASTRDARDGAALTMAAYSDTVRPDTARLSALGRPDVRLHLPRHHAVVSLTSPHGRQPAFLASTLPMQLDPDRIGHHLAAQAARGGRYLDSLEQSHWDPAVATAEDGEPAESPTASARSTITGEGSTATGVGTAASPTPSRAADSYRELAELDAVHSLRLVSPGCRLDVKVEPLDIAILDLVGELGPILSSQIHRRLAPGRALTTTQRRLKRLADARLVERFQMHRRDGGGAPMCYLLAAAGRDLLVRHGHEPPPTTDGLWTPLTEAGDEQTLLEATRRRLHAAGWVLAFARQRAGVVVRGAASSIVPVPRAGDGGPLGPAHLNLPGGLVAHDLKRTLASGRRVEPDRFETLRPDATIVLGRGPGETSIDLMVDLDDRCRSGRWTARLERYEQFLVGWSTAVRRYSEDGRATPAVVFVCRDAARARDCARRADGLLWACRAYPGERPRGWDYSGRRRIVFVAERDIHEDSTRGFGVPVLPPPMRSAAGCTEETTASLVRDICTPWWTSS
jgi:hypothetical protein